MMLYTFCFFVSLLCGLQNIQSGRNIVLSDVGPVHSQSHRWPHPSDVIPGLLQRQSGLWTCQVSQDESKVATAAAPSAQSHWNSTNERVPKPFWDYLMQFNSVVKQVRSRITTATPLYFIRSTPSSAHRFLFLFFLCVALFPRVALDRAAVLLSMKREIVRLDNVWGVGGGQRPVKHLIKEVSSVQTARMFVHLMKRSRGFCWQALPLF